MIQVIKKDVQINFPFLVIVIIGISFITLLDDPFSFLYPWTMMAITFSTFYMDQKNHSDYVLRSLPVSTNDIVLTRYLFIFVLNIVLCLYMWLLDSFQWTSQLNGDAVLSLYTFTSLLIAVTLPLYYMLQRSGLALFLHCLSSIGLFFIIVFMAAGLQPMIDFFHPVIYFQPVLFCFVFSIACFCLSYHLSRWIYSKKDIV
ncbi:ABC-2 transporter permease [Oceanobacillus piezotolerans]|uniref:ABC-2 transporter permease n=1 Tax=Oceanobacillus piezotolerans TaxID=2448030 RepID=A0A498D7R2_9BACI|nr:ABC-2 transporter permease [Oceanobacillus piezotolerans]RLL46745.1 ABC-2 transporter permease [Oceanobacillus piezotolerans]